MATHRDLLESFPESIFEADAGFVASDYDRAFDDRRLHYPLLIQLNDKQTRGGSWNGTATARDVSHSKRNSQTRRSRAFTSHATCEKLDPPEPNKKPFAAARHGGEMCSHRGEGMTFS